MGSEDLGKLFMKISAEKGNKYADKAMNNVIENERIDKIKAYLDKIVEFISVNLQAEFNRISSSSLGQISTQEIGNNLKKIIDEHLEKAIFLIEREKECDSLFNKYISDILINIKKKILKDKKTRQLAQGVYEMNLLHDFGQIVDRFSNLDVQNIDRLLRYLIWVNIKRRLDRRAFLTRC